MTFAYEEYYRAKCVVESNGSERESGHVGGPFRKGLPNPGFKKGQSGNPGGLSRSRRQARDEWHEFLEGIDRETGKTRRQTLLDAYYTFAKTDPGVCKDAIARTYGKVPDRVQVTHERDVSLDWNDDVSDAESASGTDCDTEESGEIQGGDLRPALGEDEVGRG